MDIDQISNRVLSSDDALGFLHFHEVRAAKTAGERRKQVMVHLADAASSSGSDLASAAVALKTAVEAAAERGRIDLAPVTTAVLISEPEPTASLCGTRRAGGCRAARWQCAPRS